MQTITFKAPEELNARLVLLSEKQERAKGFIVRKALEFYLAELEAEDEDYTIAMQRLAEDSPGTRVTLEQIEQENGLAG